MDELYQYSKLTMGWFEIIEELFFENALNFDPTAISRTLVTKLNINAASFK